MCTEGLRVDAIRRWCLAFWATAYARVARLLGEAAGRARQFEATGIDVHRYGAVLEGVV